MNNKILFFQSHPIQYFSPLFKEMDKTIDMEVYYYSECGLIASYDSGFGKEVKWDIPLVDGFAYQFLKNFSVSKSMDCKWFNAINFSILNVIRKTSSKILVINGWSYFSDWLVIIAGILFRKQIWVRADNPLSQELKTGWKAKLKKLILKKLLFPCFDKFLYVGTESKLFFEYYGALPNQMIYTPHAVDNLRFQNEMTSVLPQKNNIKSSLGIQPTTKIVLWSAKFISKKRPYDMIEAFQDLSLPNAVLIMLGDGILYEEIKRYVVENNLTSILLPGFVNQSEIAKYYGIADVFVMTSGKGETWGLSVNEAMNFALPIIISDACGCAYDLVQNNSNGFIYPEGDLDALNNALYTILSSSNFSSLAAEQSLEKINTFSFTTIISNIRHQLSLDESH
jgi:glycosyltransferase involved in cell wall biosynthesis